MQHPYEFLCCFEPLSPFSHCLQMSVSHSLVKGLLLKVMTIFEIKVCKEHSDCAHALNPQLFIYTALGELLWRLKSQIILVKPDTVIHSDQIQVNIFICIFNGRAEVDALVTHHFSLYCAMYQLSLRCQDPYSSCNSHQTWSEGWVFLCDYCCIIMKGVRSVKQELQVCRFE